MLLLVRERERVRDCSGISHKMLYEYANERRDRTRYTMRDTQQQSIAHNSRLPGVELT